MQVVVLLITYAVGIGVTPFVSGVPAEINKSVHSKDGLSGVVESHVEDSHAADLGHKTDSTTDVDEQMQDSEPACGPPPIVDNASVSGSLKDSYLLGSIVDYVCNFGYVAEGAVRSARCLNRRGEEHPVWTSPQITCSPRSCGDPGFVVHAHRVGSLFTFPNRVYFECEEGYELRGSASRYCQTDGRWSGKLPVCNVISCDPPSDIENGRVTYDSLEYGSELEYSCDEGYVLSNRQTVLCSANGTWTADEPFCIVAQCEHPAAPEYGTLEIIGGKIKAGSIASYACNDGRILLGSAISKCLDTGEWTFPTPECLDPCFIAEVPNGRFGRYVPVVGKRAMYFREVAVGTKVADDESLFLLCSKGYQPAGSNDYQVKVSCSRGKWSHSLHCEPTSCRTEPPATENAAISSVNQKHGGNVVYQCNSDFVKTKYGNITCDHGEWKGVTPVCTDTRCSFDALAFPGIVRPSKNFFRPGESFEPFCSKGFEVAKPENSKLQCRQNGHWEGHMPPCMAESCLQQPPSPLHGKVKSFLVFHSSVVNFECDEFFVLRGNSNVTCLFGTWKGHPPACVDSRCYVKHLKKRLGVAIENIEVTQSGDQMNVICYEGYHVENKKPFCDNGEWKEDYASPCIEDKCFVPEIDKGALTEKKVVFGSFIWSTLRYERITKYEKVSLGRTPPLNSQLFVSCYDGYTVQGKGSNHVPVVCGRGEWRPHPVCLRTGTQYTPPNRRKDSRLPVTQNKKEKVVLNEEIQKISDASAEQPENAAVEMPVDSEKQSCFCEFPAGDNQLQAYVGTKKLGYKSQVEEGKTVKFHCSDVGFYRLVGQSELTCNECRSWHSSELPSCIPPQIGDAAIFFDNNFNLTYDGFLEMEKGHTARLTCISSGVQSFPNWQIPIGSNVSIYSERVVQDGVHHYISNLDIINAKSENDGRYSCFATSLKPNSVNLRVLDSNNPRVTCSRLKEDNEIRIEYAGNLEVGTIASFLCRQRGRMLEGKTRLTCLANGSWSDEPPECNVVTCPEIKETETLRISLTDGLKYGSTATFHCFTPGVRSGVSHTKCQENGLWADQAPTCNLPPCHLDSLFSSVPEGVVPILEDVNMETVQHGAMIRLACDEGLSLSGNPQAKCGNDGLWEVSKLQCIIGCPPFNRTSDSQLIIEPVKSTYRFGDLITFSCPPGTSLSSENERIMCLSNGWSDSTIPECTRTK